VTRALVTGAGGAAGVAVILELQRSGHDAIGVDPDPLAAGSALAAEHGSLPFATDPAFLDALRSLVQEHRADVVVSTVSEEMAVIGAAAERGDDLGAPCWVSPAHSVRACIDKWCFANALTAAAVPTPPTSLGDGQLGGSPPPPGPWIVKPRFGRGSREVAAVDDPEQLAWACARTPDPIVQTRCSGREFTVDLLVDHDGTVAAAVPRWRLETRAGISTKGTTFEDARVDDVARSTVELLGLRGAANLQGFVDDAAEHPVTVVEVNPRFSGGLPLSLAAGADLVGQLVRGTLGQPLERDRLTFRPGVTMVRHYAETFSEPSAAHSPG
jgi:carbamoyl-phosphate synthase large subunit